MKIITKNDFQTLSEQFIMDASVLYSNKRSSSAYHLCGLAIECILKSAILTHLPDKATFFKKTDFYSHDLDNLLHLSELKDDLYKSEDDELVSNWETIRDWKIMDRYDPIDEKEAKRMLEATLDQEKGVWIWITNQIT